MNSLKVIVWSSLVAFSLSLLWGCSTEHSQSHVQNRFDRESVTTSVRATNALALAGENPGTNHVFTNANVVMWVPVRAARVWDGHTSYVEVGQISLPGAFVDEYKIFVEIQILTEEEFKRYSAGKPDWHFQEHPVLSVKDVPAGSALRKTIRDPRRDRLLQVNGLVLKTSTAPVDLETVKKMIDSIKLIEE